MSKKNTKIKLYATTFTFKDGKSSLTFFNNTTDCVTAAMLSIKRYINDYCDGNENILIAKTQIESIKSHSTRSKKHRIKRTICN